MEESKDYLATSILNDLLKQQQQFIDQDELLSQVLFLFVSFVYIQLKLLQSHSEMKRLIELHFEKCLIALAARKESLLRDLDNKVNHNRMIDHPPLFSPLFSIRNDLTRSSKQIETIN
jgi:hypothetical protein